MTLTEWFIDKNIHEHAFSIGKNDWFIAITIGNWCGCFVFFVPEGVSDGMRKKTRLLESHHYAVILAPSGQVAIKQIEHYLRNYVLCPDCQTRASRNGSTSSGKQIYLCANNECTRVTFRFPLIAPA